MNNKFDELTKVLAQSVTRRQAVSRFSSGLVSIALAAVGFARPSLANAPRGQQAKGYCQTDGSTLTGVCVSAYDRKIHDCHYGYPSADCPAGMAAIMPTRTDMQFCTSLVDADRPCRV